MLSLTEIFVIILIHWFADFVLQDEKWALGKSKNWSDLLKHTLLYSYVWMLFGVFYSYYNLLFEDFLWIKMSLFFPVITFVAHTITDYFTSRTVSKLFANGNYGSSIPNLGAFTVIGIDQVLHYIQLFLAFYLLK
jgi:hypothetical protein